MGGRVILTFRKEIELYLWALQHEQSPLYVGHALRSYNCRLVYSNQIIS